MNIQNQLKLWFVNDSQLAFLYEGFGIPILESLKKEYSVCLSNTSCFLEVARMVACYFDLMTMNQFRCCVLSHGI